MFKCRLEIDGRYTKLSLEKGIYLKELTELLGKLAKCLETDDIKFILTGIEGNSYDPIIETPTIEGVDKFYDIHNTIQQQDYEDLPEEYQGYADALTKILFENGIYIKATSDVNDRKIEIDTIKNTVTHHSYTVVTTLTGKIVALVGKNEKNPYITVEDFRGKTFKVFIKSEQERELSKFYKDFNIRFRVRIKNDASDEFISATLFDFTVPKYKTFDEAVNAVKAAYGDIFSNIADSAKAIREIREI
jgi:hypothetical protein